MHPHKLRQERWIALTSAPWPGVCLLNYDEDINIQTLIAFPLKKGRVKKDREVSSEINYSNRRKKWHWISSAQSSIQLYFGSLQEPSQLAFVVGMQKEMGTHGANGLSLEQFTHSSLLFQQFFSALDQQKTAILLLTTQLLRIVYSIQYM